MIFKKILCSHEWVKLSEIVTESSFELAMKALSNPRLEKIYFPENAFNSDKKVIQVFSCHKCGKLKRFVEKV